MSGGGSYGLTTITRVILEPEQRRYYIYETIQQHRQQAYVTAYSTGIRLFVLTSITEGVRGLPMKTMKRNRLRQLVSWGFMTQAQANEQWRQYLRLFKRANADLKRQGLPYQ